MWLLIDDTRCINCDIICRTYDSAIAVLMNMSGRFECMIFDHDLGEEDDRKNGYSVLEFALNNELLANRVQLITSNPVGLQKMRDALKTAGYKSINGLDFTK